MFQFIGRGIKKLVRNESHHARLQNVCSKRPASQKQKDDRVNQVLGRTREAAHLSFFLSGGARGGTPCDVGDRAEHKLSSTTSPGGGGAAQALLARPHAPVARGAVPVVAGLLDMSGLLTRAANLVAPLNDELRPTVAKSSKHVSVAVAVGHEVIGTTRARGR